MKRYTVHFAAALLALMLCFVLLPVEPLSAHAQKLQQFLIVKPVNIPENAEYLELLIKMDADDANYTSCNEKNMEQYSFDKSVLASYESGGFISFSYHYRDRETELFTDMRIDRDRLAKNGWTSNCFTCERNENGELSGNWRAMRDLKTSDRVMRVAALDMNGNIIQVSEPFEVSGKNGDIDSDVSYDVGNNLIEVSHDGDDQPFMPLYALVYLSAASPLLAAGIAAAVIAAAVILTVTLIVVIKKCRAKNKAR